MVRTQENIAAIDMAREIVDIIADKKGENIVLLDLRERTIITDYFVICDGSSERQLKAIVDGIQEELKKEYGTRPGRVDGAAHTGWVLLDYGDIIVHAFSPETRQYYDLESLWEEARIVLKMQ